jgi:hypothetical protein
VTAVMIPPRPKGWRPQRTASYRPLVRGTWCATCSGQGRVWEPVVVPEGDGDPERSVYVERPDGQVVPLLMAVACESCGARGWV